MAEPNARPNGMAMVLIAAPPPVTSLQWVGRGPIRRILFNSFNWLRKKLFIESINFILFYPPLPTRPPQHNQMRPPPLHSPTVALRSILSLVFGWLLHIFNSSGAI
jgi:hypothetical protein